MTQVNIIKGDTFTTFEPAYSNIVADVIISKKNELDCGVSTGDYRVLQIINECLSYEDDHIKFVKKKPKGWDGKTHLLNLAAKSFPMGLYKMVVKCLINNGCRVSVDNLLKTKPFVSRDDFVEIIESWDLVMSPYDYQIDGALEIINKNKLAVLSITASGKSFIIYLVLRFFAMNNPACKMLLVVPYASLVDQMRGDFSSYESDDFLAEKCCMVRQGMKYNENSSIVITTYQSLNIMEAKQKSMLLESVKVVCIDEAHITGIDASLRKCINSVIRFGVTGTMQNVKTHIMRFTAFFGDIVELNDYKMLNDMGVVSYVYMNIVNIEYNKEFDQTVVDMTNEGLEKFMEKNPDGEVHPTFYYNMEKAALRSNYERMKVICNLGIALANKGSNVMMIFQDDIDMLKRYHDFASRGFRGLVHMVYGGTDVEDRELVRASVDSGAAAGSMMMCSKVFSTGINIKNINDIVICQIGKSKNLVLQIVGRGLRKSDVKNEVNVWDIVDRFQPYRGSTPYSVVHYNERIKYYKQQKYDIQPKYIKACDAYNIGYFINSYERGKNEQN